MAYLKLGNLVFGDLARPPRLPYNRSRTQRSYTPAAHNLPGVWSDYGLAEHFTHTLQSQNQTGHLTLAEVRQLEALEEAGTPFVLQTDFFAAENEVETYTARFDPENKPLYTPVTIHNNSWVFVYQLALFIYPELPTP